MTMKGSITSIALDDVASPSTPYVPVFSQHSCPLLLSHKGKAFTAAVAQAATAAGVATGQPLA